MVYGGPLQATGIAKSLPKCCSELAPKRRTSSCLAVHTQREKLIFSLGPPTDVSWDAGEAPPSPAGAPCSAGEMGCQRQLQRGEGLLGLSPGVTVPVHPQALPREMLHP